MSELKRIRILGHDLELHDESSSRTIEFIEAEMNSALVKDFLSQITNNLPITLFDIGAHVGTFSILFKKLFPSSEVIALEPVPMNFENLKKNIASHGYEESIKPLNKAVWVEGEQLTSLLMGKDNTGSASVMNYPDTLLIEGLSSVTLNQIFKDQILAFQPRKTVVMKMDIERAEYRVFENFSYWDYVDYLLIEIHEDLAATPRDKKASALNLLESLKHRGVKIFASFPFVNYHNGTFRA